MAQNTVKAIFPGIGEVQISRERSDQILRLQRIIREQRAKDIQNKNTTK